MARPVEELPKAHLHLHFTGSARVETVRDLADKHKLSIIALHTAAETLPIRDAA